MSLSAENIWDQVLTEIQSDINQQSYSIWLKDTKALNFDNDTLNIKVQDEVAKKQINNSYSEMISSLLLKITGKNVNFNFIIDEGDFKENDKETFNKSEFKNKLLDENEIQPGAGLNQDNNILRLNPHYKFDTFIVGPNNQLAHAAAVSISKAPATQYNPLFLYGDSGLGKTHLMQAIGHTIMAEKPYLRVLYVTSEQFVNEFIHAIRTSTIQSFKIKYRNVDILLIDDIQFISNKEQTQEEFFHTFNDLHNDNKQIIISSDRPPKELSSLTDRLRTRFEWGLIADIQAPNLETREAILRSKAERDNIIITDEVINYIATRITSNIRALESSLKKLHIVASVHNDPITIQLAKMHLRPLFEEKSNKNITLDDIINKVCEQFNASADDIKSKSRQSSIIKPRFIAMYLATKLTNLTTTEIGSHFGGRDHSTVINARNNIEKELINDEMFKELVDDIISDIKC